MTEVLQHPTKPPKPGDLIELVQERTIPTGTWHLDLSELLDELGHELADELLQRGIRVGYNAFLSRAESTAFTYTLIVALRVHDVGEPRPGEEVVLEASLGASFWVIFGTVSFLVGLGFTGWITGNVARTVEAAPDVVAEASATIQVVAVAAALIAFVWILNKALR